MKPTAARTLEAGKEAAGRVFGWQHLVRYSGESADWMGDVLGAVVREAVKAAAPLIAAQALRDAAENPDGLMESLSAEDDAQFIGGSSHGAGPGESHGVMTDWLEARADRIESARPVPRRAPRVP